MCGGGKTLEVGSSREGGACKAGAWLGCGGGVWAREGPAGVWAWPMWCGRDLRTWIWHVVSGAETFLMGVACMIIGGGACLRVEPLGEWAGPFGEGVVYG